MAQRFIPLRHWDSNAIPPGRDDLSANSQFSERPKPAPSCFHASRCQFVSGDRSFWGCNTELSRPADHRPAPPVLRNVSSASLTYLQGSASATCYIHNRSSQSLPHQTNLRIRRGGESGQSLKPNHHHRLFRSNAFRRFSGLSFSPERCCHFSPPSASHNIFARQAAPASSGLEPSSSR